MDEFTFQYELHRLKDQIEDMAEMRRVQQFPQRAPPQPFYQPRDVFLDQMRDLKEHLAGLDRRFTNICDAQRMAAQYQAPQYPQSMPVLAGPQGTAMPSPHNQLALPSAPQFWELFTSLRTDVQGLDGRVAGLEQTVSDLEDKVDGMDSLRFTPPGSTMSDEERASYLRMNSAHPEMLNSSNTNAATFPPPAWSFNPPYEATCNEGPTTTPPAHVRLPSISDLLAPLEEQSRPVIADIKRPSPTMSGYNAELAGATLTMLHRINDTIKGPNPVFSMNSSKLARAIVDLNLKYLDAGVDLGPPASAGLLNMCEPQEGVQAEAGDVNLAEMEACNKEPVTGATGVFLAEQEIGALWDSSLMAYPATKNGATFRDQEISRLDELLRTAQEDLIASEQRVLKHKEELQIVQDQHQRREESVREELVKANGSAGLVMQLTASLRAQEAEADELRDGRDQLGEAVMDFQRKLGGAKEHIGELQTALNDNLEREQDNERVLAQRLDELREVQAFCDNKDSVVRRQEQVIARGARLLEERDDEIESLTRRLKVEADDRQHESRHTTRLSKLLEERDTELAHIKAGIAHACAIPQRSPRTFNGDLKSPDKQNALIKAHLDRCAEVAGVPGPRDYELVEHVAQDGSSEAIAVLKSDPKQAYKFWEDGVPHWSQSESRLAGGEQTQHEFGKPSPIPQNRSRGVAGHADEQGEQAQARHGSGKASSGSQRRSRGSPRQQVDIGSRQRKVRHLQDGDVFDSSAQFVRSSERDAERFLHEEEFLRDQAQARSSAGNQEAFMQAVANHGLGAAQTPPDYYPSGRPSASPLRAPPRDQQPTGRHGLPLDRTFWPPLPAPVSAQQQTQRMQSMADMRSAARNQPQRRVARHHQSMQELPRQHQQRRRDLQAYVETEESGGELGGDV